MPCTDCYNSCKTCCGLNRPKENYLWYASLCILVILARLHLSRSRPSKVPSSKGPHGLALSAALGCLDAVAGAHSLVAWSWVECCTHRQLCCGDFWNRRSLHSREGLLCSSVSFLGRKFPSTAAKTMDGISPYRRLQMQGLLPCRGSL